MTKEEAMRGLEQSINDKDKILEMRGKAQTAVEDKILLSRQKLAEEDISYYQRYLETLEGGAVQ